MKNSIIIVIVLVLIGAFAFMFATKKSEAPVDQNPITTTSTSSAPIASGTYTLDTQKSSIGWRGEKIVGSSEEGTVKFTSGSFVFASTSASGKFVIDMNTIESIPVKDQLITHLKSADFFDVAKYPTGTFEVTSVAATSEGSGRYVVAGNLTVKGIKKPVSLIATISPDGNTLRATGSFAINRAEWQIRYGSTSFFNDLGDKAIRDSVMITLDLLATKVIQ